MKTSLASSGRRGAAAGFTLVEVLISMSIAVTTLALAMGVFVFSLRIMYRDNQRLVTNATLRYFVAQVSKETLDASEFYIFRTYQDLDGSVDLTTSVSDYTTTTPEGIDLFHGDCLVLVTRFTIDATANISQVRIYYREVTNSNSEGRIRYWESRPLPSSGAGSTADAAALLSTFNFRSNSAYVGTGTNRILAQRSRGRPKKDPVTGALSTTDFYPIFSSENPTVSKDNRSVAVNAEVINGTTQNNLLSSSSFNYTISPRR